MDTKCEQFYARVFLQHVDKIFLSLWEGYISQFWNTVGRGNLKPSFI